MEEKQVQRISTSAPNLINICIDKNEGENLTGRLYHCYDENPLEFSDIIQLFNLMDRFFDRIAFPQASVRFRSLAGQKEIVEVKPEKITEIEEVLKHTGKKGSFAACVRNRQNADWQGEITWMEKGITWHFYSALELIKIVDNSII